MRPLTIVLFTAILSMALNAQAAKLRLIGSHVIPTDTTFAGEAFGGISGIAHTNTGDYLAISDARGGEHGGPRYYRLTLDYDANAFKGVNINSLHYLQQANGKPFPKDQATVDPESIRIGPNGHYYWSSEGAFNTTQTNVHQPQITEMQADGQFVRHFQIPDMYLYQDNKTAGGRSNQLFESLAIDQNGYLYTMNEDTLIQDGDPASARYNGLTRLTQFDPKTAQPMQQYAYVLSYTPMNGQNGNQYSPPINGVTAMLALKENAFLVLERAYAKYNGNIIRLVKASISDNTTDVSKITDLRKQAYRPMRKETVLFIPPLYTGLKTDNIEAMTWGKTLANGNRTLVLVSDNNFSQRQTTQFFVYEVIGDF